MQNNLLSIFNAITPDNIKNIKLIEDSMEIFIELLNEKSYISSDIKEVLSEKTTESISEELPKIYLSDYTSMLDNLKSSNSVINKFKRWNETLNPSIYPTGLPYIGPNLYVNYFLIGQSGAALSLNDEDSTDDAFTLDPYSKKLDKLAGNLLKNTPENYFINRKFKESKGLEKGIKFIYNIINNSIVPEEERKEIIISETGTPFELNIIGSIDKDIYINSVAFLTHPLGFTYNYLYLTEMSFEDSYYAKKYYTNTFVEVRCLYAENEIYNKEISNVIEKTNYLKIEFTDGTYLLQEKDIVKYFNSDGNLIKFYPEENHCSIYLEYTIEYKTSILEEFSSRLQTEDSDTFSINSDSSDFLSSTNFKEDFIIDGLKSTIIGDGDLISNDTDFYQVALIDEDFSIEII